MENNYKIYQFKNNDGTFNALIYKNSMFHQFFYGISKLELNEIKKKLMI